MVISSGYRSARYNQKLRDRGRTVALASLHLYGMAVDLRMTGVEPRRIWELVRARRLGGAGLYDDGWVHVDVGPARSWMQASANVRTGQSEHNQRVILVPDYDIYQAGESMRLRFARITAYPLAIEPTFVLEGPADQAPARASARSRVKVKWPPAASRTTRCLVFGDDAPLDQVQVPLAADMPPGRYRLRAQFCGSRALGAAREVASYVFEVVGPAGKPAKTS